MCLWFYYQFCKEYGRTPGDYDDLCDGLKMMSVRNEADMVYSEA